MKIAFRCFAKFIIMVGAVVGWGWLGKKVGGLSDVALVCAPLGVAFLIFFLEVWKRPMLTERRVAKGLLTAGGAVLLSILWVWLSFVIAWGLFGGSAP